MKSPVTGKEMTLVREKTMYAFRGESYECEQSLWRCEDSGETYTTDEMDMEAFEQVSRQYRAKYGLPSKDEIIALRERYALSAAKMSLILGIGVNQWRLYEAGEVPSVSNGRLIRAIKDARVFLDLVNSAKHQLGPREFGKISARLRLLLSEDEQ